jgi:DNA-binding XRE family transcriptional regulator
MQPGVTIALRLVSATGADVGDFFQNLAINNGLLPLPDASGSGRKIEAKNQSLKGIELPQDKLYAAKSVFGVFFKEIRLMYHVTQKTVAERSRYNLRNLLTVESGQQEPGVMTALAMVCAVGVDIVEFFEELYRLQKEVLPN